MSCEILEAAVVCSLSLSSLLSSLALLFCLTKKTTTTYQKDESDLADSLFPPLSSFFLGLFTLETLDSGQKREVELNCCVSFLLSKA